MTRPFFLMILMTAGVKRHKEYSFFMNLEAVKGCLVFMILFQNLDSV